MGKWVFHFALKNTCPSYTYLLYVIVDKNCIWIPKKKQLCCIFVKNIYISFFVYTIMH